ncbi:TRAP transporter large permease [Cuneatibacter sp. NSJ-177]|uniref:TRAP transporter large permease n=1 Tax=Cuneatibacter sp. NSJ-177 TaxID=2931401 RepID=UPI001FD14DFD|nr:TRAP transporter large permease [Cuneatibacter sp. NSJ-177]MCJ7836647.1 TRAP transporter large permease [Cuneatibacter sp. NSJ-177]
MGGVGLLLVIVVTMLLGLPVFVALGLTGTLGLIMTSNAGLAGISWPVIAKNVYSGISAYAQLAVPLFILAGEIMNTSGITDRLVRFASMLIGRMPASLAQTTVLTSMFFGGITGSAQATTACVGGNMIPAMVREGYPKETAVAVSACASSCGPVIPPSIMMILYGCSVGASIGGLFMGGILPGVLLGLGLMTVVFLQDRRKHFPRRKMKYTREEKWAITKDSIFPLLMPVIIVGGIMGGICTPTEAAAVAVAYALFVGLVIYRNITWKNMLQMLKNAVVTTASTLLIIGVAKLVGYVFTALQVPTILANAFMAISDSKYVFLLMVNILLLIMGMFMDGGASIVIFAPILVPIATALGVDPIHFGVIMTLNMAMGTATPPLGLCLFIGCNIADLPVEKGAKAVLPYVAGELVVLMLVTYLPEIVLFIPRMLGYV